MREIKFRACLKDKKAVPFWYRENIFLYDRG